MKATLLTIVFTAFLLSSTYSQTVSNVPLRDIGVEYILINGEGRPGNKIAIYLDFGQKNKSFNKRNDMLLNEDNIPMEFNSIIGAFNFLAKYRYELVETYVVPSEMSGYTYYILKKKKV